MYTTTCLFHWPRNILLTQWTRIQREAYSISVRKHLCLVLILGNVGGCRCDSCLILIKKVAGRVWIPDAARKRILIVAFDLTYWVLDFAPYIYCRATPEQVKYLWDVTPALWCNQCYLDNFVVHSAKGVFCHNVPYMPRVAIALSLDIEAKVKVIWNSLAAGQCLDPVIENYAKAPTAQDTQRYGSTQMGLKSQPRIWVTERLQHSVLGYKRRGPPLRLLPWRSPLPMQPPRRPVWAGIGTTQIDALALSPISPAVVSSGSESEADDCLKLM